MSEEKERERERVIGRGGGENSRQNRPARCPSNSKLAYSKVTWLVPSTAESRVESNRIAPNRAMPCRTAPRQPGIQILLCTTQRCQLIATKPAGCCLDRSTLFVRLLACMLTCLSVCLSLRYLVHSYVVRSSIRPSLREKQRCLGFLSLPCLTHALTAFPFAKTPLIFDHYPIFFFFSSRKTKHVVVPCIHR